MNKPAARLVAATAVGEANDAKYVQKIRCGQHSLLADEPAFRGGKDVGPSPFGYVLSGLAACTSITLRMFAERHGWHLGTVTVDAELWREGDINRIERKVSISAPLDEAQRAKIADICERTPVTLALKKEMTISTVLTSG